MAHVHETVFPPAKGNKVKSSQFARNLTTPELSHCAILLYTFIIGAGVTQGEYVMNTCGICIVCHAEACRACELVTI